MKQKETYSVSRTVQKVFHLLELLAEIQPAKPADLSRRLELSRSNIYRLLATLENLGYVTKDNKSHYLLSFKLFTLGNSVPSNNYLSEIASPYLARLASKSLETVNLAVMYEKEVLYINKVDSPHHLRLDKPIGKTDPLYCTALGKTLLSGLDDSEIHDFLQSVKLTPYTRNTILQPEKLFNSLRVIRSQGYAIDSEELMEGVNCVAAPIRDHYNKIIAAIGISGPSVRLTKRKIEQFIPSLIEASVSISKQLGCTFSGVLDPFIQKR